MSRPFLLSLVCCALVLVGWLRAAPKEFKDNSGNGKGSDPSNFDDGTDTAPPGASDVVRIKHGKKVTLDVSPTWGSIDFSGGTIDVDGIQSLTLALGTSLWTGGEIAGATVNSTVGMTIGAGGEDPKKIKNNGKLNLGGSTSWTGESLGVADAAEITNTGSFTNTFDGTITHDGGTRGKFKNEGSFVKSGGTTATGTEIQAIFENTATGASVQVDAGALKLTGGGTSSKAVTLADGTKLQISGNDFEFSGGALNGNGSGATKGTIEVSSFVTTFGNTTGTADLAVSGTGTAKINGSHQTTGRLKLSSGKVDGTTNTSAATVAGFDWTGGDVTTAVINSSSTTIGLGSAKNLNGGAKLNLSNTTTWSGDALATSASAQINNTGTFTTSFDGALTSDGSTTFTNSGIFEKSAGTATGTTIGATFESSGTIKATAGTLKLNGGGTSSGLGNKVNIGAGGKLDVGGGYVFNATAFEGDGTFDLTGATTTFKGATGNAKVSLKGGDVDFSDSASTLGSLTLESGTITSSASGSTSVGSLTWTGGGVNGKVTSTGGSAVSGTATKTIGAGGELSLSGVATNTWSGGIITNEGKLSHNAGATDIQTSFANSGNVTVGENAGTLKLTGGGTSSGTGNSVLVNAGGKLQIATTGYTFDGTAFDGGGTVELGGATTTFKGATGSAKLSLNGGKAAFDSSLSKVSDLSLSSISSDITTTNSGELETGSLGWTAGAIKGKVTITGATTIGNGSTKTLSGATAELVLGGTTQWTGAAGDAIATSSGGKIKNTGTFSTNFDGTISADTNTAQGTFTNNGSFKKTGGAANSATTIAAAFENTNGVEIDENGGTLKLTGGGSSSGTGNNVKVKAGGKLKIDTNAYTFDGTDFDGAGTVELGSATTTLKNTSGSAKLSVKGGTAKFEGAHNGSGKLELSSGKVEGANSATFGTIDWTGGEINATTVIASGGTIGAGNAKSLKGGAKLKLSGTTLWDGDDLATQDDAEITNDGNFTAGASGKISHNSASTRGTFKNNGLFAKTGAGTDTEIETIFENASTVNIGSGKLKLSGGGRNKDGAGIEVAAFAQLDIAGDITLEALSELKGNGLARLLSGRLTANGVIAIKNFDFNAGELDGSNTFQGTLNWNGGHWNASASGYSTTIDAGAVLHLRHGSFHDFNKRSIVNRGTVNWHSGNLRGGNGSDFLNDTSGAFEDLSTGSKSIGSVGGSATFTNKGSFHKSVAGTTTVDIPFANSSGTVRVDAGTLHFTNSFTQSAGVLNVGAGAIVKFDQGLNLGGGTLTGSGTLQADVTNSGLLNPGSSPGTLTITGNLTLSATSVVRFELGGSDPGVTYDFISVAGGTVLDGQLEISFVNNFLNVVTPANTFTLLTASGAGGLSGLFTNVANGQRLVALDGIGSFKVNYGAASAFAASIGANSVVLSDFTAVPEPSTWVLMLSGMGAVALLARRRRR